MKMQKIINMPKKKSSFWAFLKNKKICVTGDISEGRTGGSTGGVTGGSTGGATGDGKF